MKIHMVKKGDSLYSIAQKHGVTVEELLQLNPGIANPDAIDVGMKIKVPAAKAPAGDWVHQHKVVQGDTLWKLSKAWGIPLADMIQANPQLKNPNVLMTGEIVNIPKAASAGSGHMDAHGAETGFPGLTELQHIEGGQPVPGKAFTGVMPGKKPTAPIEEPKPIEPEAVAPTPAPEPPPMPLPTPVEPPKIEVPKMPKPAPMPLPLPVEQPKSGYGVPMKPEIPVMPEQAIDLFKQFHVPAAEAFAPHGYPAAPPMPVFGAEAGAGGYPVPGHLMPSAQGPASYPMPEHAMPSAQGPANYPMPEHALPSVHGPIGNPCPPGTVPLGVWAEAGAGPVPGHGVYAAAGPGVFAAAMPGMQPMPMQEGVQGAYDMAGGYGMHAGEAYGPGTGLGMEAHVHGWPGLQAGAQDGYGMMPAHGWPAAGGYGLPHAYAPYPGGYGMMPAAAPMPLAPGYGHHHPCPCGGYDPRQFAGAAAVPAGSGAQAPEPEAAQDESRKSGKKAAVRSGSGSSRAGGGARARISGSAPRRPQASQKRGSRPWINR